MQNDNLNELIVMIDSTVYNMPDINRLKSTKLKDKHYISYQVLSDNKTAKQLTDLILITAEEFKFEHVHKI